MAAARSRSAGLDEGSPFALRAETVVLQSQDELGGEAVVEFRDVDAPDPDPGLAECDVACVGAIRAREVRLVPPGVASRIAESDPLHEDRFLPQVLCSLGSRHDDGAP